MNSSRRCHSKHRGRERIVKNNHSSISEFILFLEKKTVILKAHFMKIKKKKKGYKRGQASESWRGHRVYLHCFEFTFYCFLLGMITFHQISQKKKKQNHWKLFITRIENKQQKPTRIRAIKSLLIRFFWKQFQTLSNEIFLVVFLVPIIRFTVWRKHEPPTKNIQGKR